MQHEAHERSYPLPALTPILEDPECSGKPDWESGPAPNERTAPSERISPFSSFDASLSGAETLRPDESDDDERDARVERVERVEPERVERVEPERVERVEPERAERGAATRTAVKLTTWRGVEEWPAHWSASGRVTLRGSDDPQVGTMRAVCRICDGVLTLVRIDQQGAAGEVTEKVVAEVPLEDLAVGLQRGRTNMFTLATVHQNKMFDEIYCFCDDPARRNKWVAVFRRMGVAVFDLLD